MSNVVGFECVEFGRRHGTGEVEYVCVSCGGNLDVLYDYNRARAQITRDVLALDRNFTMWRYAALLPIEDMSVIPPLTVGWTPIYDCAHLANRYGTRQLLIKDEGRNPTASLKDRPSALCVTKALSRRFHSKGEYPDSERAVRVQSTYYG